MRQVSAVRQLEPQQRVARFEHRKKRREVGLGPTVRLHVGVLRPEQLPGTIDGELLHLVHHLAPTVVARGRIPLRVLVRQDGAHRLQHRERREVLARDQFESGILPPLLGLKQAGHDRIGCRQRAGEIAHAVLVFCTFASAMRCSASRSAAR
jgi:hypothetical protein